MENDTMMLTVAVLKKELEEQDTRMQTFFGNLLNTSSNGEWKSESPRSRNAEEEGRKSMGSTTSTVGSSPERKSTKGSTLARQLTSRSMKSAKSMENFPAMPPSLDDEEEEEEHEFLGRHLTSNLAGEVINDHRRKSVKLERKSVGKQNSPNLSMSAARQTVGQLFGGVSRRKTAPVMPIEDVSRKSAPGHVSSAGVPPAIAPPCASAKHDRKRATAHFQTTDIQSSRQSDEVASSLSSSDVHDAPPPPSPAWLSPLPAASVPETEAPQLHDVPPTQHSSSSHAPPMRASTVTTHTTLTRRTSISSNYSEECADLSPDFGIDEQGPQHSASHRPLAKAISKAAFTHHASFSSVDSMEDSWHEWLRELVSSHMFEFGSCLMVILSAFAIGYETDYNARHPTEDSPKLMGILEVMFCTVFTSEIALRIYCARCDFFAGVEWQWNIFDFLVVLNQLLENVMSLVVTLIAQGDEAQLPKNFAVLRLIRLLKLVRIMRLLRVLRVIGELRTIVVSIFGSMKFLFWTSVLIFMLLYLIGIFFTQLVVDFKVSRLQTGQDYNEAFDTYFATLGLALISLFQCISGGVDWDNMSRPLTQDIHPLLGCVFTLYIAFAVLCLMNVVTGVFVEVAVLRAKKDSDAFMVNHARHLFQTLDIDNSGTITWEEFKDQLHAKDMKEYFKAIDVDLSEAKGLFRLLDIGRTGVINPESFIAASQRLRGPAKALDVTLVLYENRRLFELNKKRACFIEESLAWVARALSRAGITPDEDSDDSEADMQSQNTESFLTKSGPLMRGHRGSNESTFTTDHSKLKLGKTSEGESKSGGSQDSQSLRPPSFQENNDVGPVDF